MKGFSGPGLKPARAGRVTFQRGVPLSFPLTLISLVRKPQGADPGVFFPQADLSITFLTSQGTTVAFLSSQINPY